MIKRILLASLLVVMAGALCLSAGASAQDKVTFGIVTELSGFGAVFGMRWERGVLMAVEEINASGGLLGKKIETFTLDTKTEAPVSVAAMRKAVERSPFVVIGPIYSGSNLACMGVLQQAGIPQFTGAESPTITKQGNKNIFRTCLNAELGMQKVVKWLSDVLKVKNLALVWANTEFGKGGRDALIQLLTPRGVKIVADIATEAGQTSFAGELSRVKASGADTLFLYMHEEESGRILPQIKEMGLEKSMRIVGHTTLMSEDTLRLAKESANGVVGHMGEVAVAPPLRATAARYEQKYKEIPDHSFYKSYIGTMVVKAAVEEIKSFDQQKLRDYLHNRTLCVKDHPEILMDIHFDENGDIDRDSFLVKIENQKQVLSTILPPLHPEWFVQCGKK